MTFADGEGSDSAPVARTGDLTFVVTPEGEPPQLPFPLIPAPTAAPSTPTPRRGRSERLPDRLSSYCFTGH